MKRWPQARPRYRSLPWLILALLVAMAMAGTLTLYYVRKQVIVSTGETFALAAAFLAGPLLAFVSWSTWRLHNDWTRTVESEERLVTTLRSIGEVFLATDASGRVTMMNGVAQQLTGWSESEALGRPLDEVFQIQQPATQEPRESPFAGALRGEAPAAAPDYATLVTRGGVERLTFQSVAPIRNAAGQVYGVVLVARDVTERLRAVEALRTTMRRLEQQSAALAEQARNPALLGSDLPTALRTITEVAARTLEVKRASVWFYSEDRSKLLCADLFEKDTERHSTGMELAASENPAYFRALAEGRGIAVRDARGDAQTRELAGTYLESLGIFSMLAAPIGAGGQVVGVVCHEQTSAPREWMLDEQSFAASIADLVALSFEVCRRRQAEAALREARDDLERKVDERTRDLAEANERLQELDRLKSEFLATMSHELRTPLNSIIGFTGILRQELAGPLNDEQKKQLGMVQSAGRHLLGLINDLLDLSRIESGRLQVTRERFKIASVVEEVATSLAPLVAQKRLRFATELDDPALELCSDRKKCFQILLNLANNAVKFTRQGVVTIRVSSSPEGVTIVVSDTGIGIKPGSMAHLFEAFRQVDGSARRVYEGTGLGLYLCKQLTGLLGGEIRAESEFGSGSRFTVTFPRETAEATI